ncbi:hypothetical protein CEXT_564731 [Caerostris extrusa]|uniref:Uncharacterized protein n=1 Tax=Caerostris extrusa TaxID=172846 RepID=A0AAV4WKV8_CAEEX|nr:hypothetical protein CEXT_564731 [Caerostris extrusa]
MLHLPYISSGEAILQHEKEGWIRGRNDFHGQHKTFTFEHLSDSKYSRNGALGKVFPLWNDAILEFEIPANVPSRR